LGLQMRAKELGRLAFRYSPPGCGFLPVRQR
jgi:hypothetical protein